MTPRLATAGMFFVNGAVLGSWAAHIPFVRDQLAISKSTIGLALLAMAAGAVVAMPIAGQLLERRPSASIVRVLAIVEPPLLILLLLAPTPLALMAMLLVFGAVNGAFDVSQNAHGGAIEAQLGRPIMSSLHAGWSLGGLAGAGLAGLGALAGLDPRIQLVLVAALLLGIVALCVPHLGSASTVTHRKRPARRRRRLSLPPPSALALGALAATFMLAEGSVIDWSALYMRDSLDGSAGLAAAAYGAFALGMAAGRLGGDALNRAFGSTPLVQAGSGVAAVSLGGLLLAATPVVALPALVLVGLGVANTVPLLFSAAARIPGMGPGPGMASVTTIGYLGLLAGPPAVGFLADATSLPVALGCTSALIAITAVVAGPVLARTTTPVAAREPACAAPTGSAA